MTTPPAGAPVPEAEARELLATAIEEHFSFATRALPALTVLIAVTAFMVWHEYRDAAALAGAGILVAIFFVRLGVSLLYHRGPVRSPAAWERISLGVSGAIALVYAATFWILLRPGHPEVNAALVACFLLNLAGFLSYSAGLNRTVIAFSLLFGGGLALRLAFLPGSGWNLIMSLAVAAFSASQIGIALRATRLQQASLRNAIASRKMAAALEEQVNVSRAATQAAVEASLEKSRFVAAASHDLRQPLHAMALTASSMAGHFRGTPREKEFDRILQSLGALEHSLTSMLDISKLDSGAVVPAFRRTSITSIFQSVRQTFAARAEGRGLGLRFRACDCDIYTDPQMMTRLIGNLVDNAIKYTPSGAIHVSAQRHPSQPGMVRIDVRDSGVGIPEALHRQVFQEFFQANTGRVRATGLGLGLSIVTRLAHGTGATIEVRSAPGCGSRFRVICPAAPGEAPPEPAPPAPEAETPAPSIAGRHILVVDNEPDILAAMATLLEEEGAIVRCAPDSGTALAQAANGPLDAAVLDYRLDDGTTGLALRAELLARYGPLPMLLVTGDISAEDVLLLGESGARVLYKPVAGAVLKRALGELMQGRDTRLERAAPGPGSAP